MERRDQHRSARLFLNAREARVAEEKEHQPCQGLACSHEMRGVWLPFDDQLRMKPAKRLRHMAIPADGLMRRKNFWQLLWRNILPVKSRSFRADQCGRMIGVMEHTERFMAKRTFFSFVPLGDDIPYQAVLRVGLDLPQALLAASLALWPARTLLQAQSGLGKKRSHRSFADGYIDSLWGVIFGAGDKPFAPVIEISAQRRDGSKYEQSHRKRKYRDHDQHYGGHTSPQSSVFNLPGLPVRHSL